MSDSNTPESTPLSYKDAGVDIKAGNTLVDRIKGVAKRTRRREVLAGLGGFGALCAIPEGYRQPILVSGTDGVGTKLKLAMDLNNHGSIGIDLVAMCVNDIIVTGAEPLFFLDYYATGHLNVDVAASVVEGIGEGCGLAGCSLVGGETAEMPGMYSGEDYDLAGFCVGVVEKEHIITGDQVTAGDALIALASSGPHSNGYSLIRKILEISDKPLNTRLESHGANDDCTIGDALLAPTRIYVKSLLNIQKQLPLKALAHITGGGLTENLPRVLPDQTVAHLQTSSWQWPEIFTWLQHQGNVTTSEMYRTFNCGVGMVLCVAKEHAQQALKLLAKEGETAWIIGSVESGNKTEPHVNFS